MGGAFGMALVLAAALLGHPRRCRALQPVRLLPRADGSMRLVTAPSSGCGAELAPRGVSLAVKGPPWVPVTDHFTTETSLNHYDFEQLATAGVTLIRLGSMMPGVLPKAPVDGVYEHDEEYIGKLQHLVDMAAAHGMYTLIEFHQDVISQYYCGEGLPRWAADEIHAAFPAEFEEEVLELLHSMTVDIPGLEGLEDKLFRERIRSKAADAGFPAPVAEPFPVRADKFQVYDQDDCNRLSWYVYQLTFAAGHAYRRLFDLTSSTFRHVKTYWQILARAFEGNPNVLAFDLFNEPFPGSFWTEPWVVAPANAARRLTPFYREIAEAVHEIDSKRLITFSPVTWEEGGFFVRELRGKSSQMCMWLEQLLHFSLPGCETFWDVTRWIGASGIEESAFTEAPLKGQSILSFHFYTPPELNHEAYARKRKADVQKLHVYPLLSETCCVSDVDFLQRIFWFEKARIGWVTWEYKNMASDNYGAQITGTGPSMFHHDGTPIKDNWRRLAHPSAQYVYGEVLANIFDFTVGMFNLTFLPISGCKPPDGAPDAIIIWPWMWWAYINIGSQPRIQVVPADAAEVSEFTGNWAAAPVVQYGVRLLRRNLSHLAASDLTVTVTLSFMNFQNIDLIPEEAEPTVLGPWYQGLVWPVMLFALLALHLSLLTWCCRRCCHPGKPANQVGAEPSTSDARALSDATAQSEFCASMSGSDRPLLGRRHHTDAEVQPLHERDGSDAEVPPSQKPSWKSGAPWTLGDDGL